MNLDTGEPTDELTSQAKQMVRELGSRNTTVSGIIEEQDKAVFAAIQEGLDRANQQSTSRAQKVWAQDTHKRMWLLITICTLEFSLKL